MAQGTTPQQQTTAAVHAAQDAQAMRWKVAMWSKDTTEPAMLRSPIVLIFLLFLWAGNVWLLEKMGISYHGVLSIKASPLTFSLVMAVILAIAYAVTITLFSNVLGLTVEASVTIFYVLLILSQTLLPATLPGQETKASFYRLLRIVFFPGSTISFSEVLLADALCSLSKVFKDYGVTIIAIYANISGASVVDLHEEGMLLCALLASLPFWLRVRQCWVQLEGCKDSVAKIPITLNIIKYISAFPPIWLAAAASLGYFHPALPTFTAAMATINSVYSYLVSDLYPFYFLAICRLVRSADYSPPLPLSTTVGRYSGLGLAAVFTRGSGLWPTAYHVPRRCIRLCLCYQPCYSLCVGGEPRPFPRRHPRLAPRAHGRARRGCAKGHVEPFSRRVGDHRAGRAG
jgi:hypothetical protein